MEENFFKYTLEHCGEDGYEQYRVPGITVTANGTIVAYYDARKTENGKPMQKIFMRRSLDGGNSWEKRRELVAEKDGTRVHNPLMISGKGNELYFLWNTDYCRCFIKKSCDNGITWSKTNEITATFQQFQTSYPWKVFALSPGHGIELTSGRLVVPFWMSISDQHKPACGGCIFSDDKGESWQCGSLVNATEEVDSPTDSSLAQRSDSSLLLTMRHNGKSRRRAFAYADAPNKLWKAYVDPNLPDPICAGSICNVPIAEHKILLFANCAWDDMPAQESMRRGEKIAWSKDARRNFTIRISHDDGVTWSKGTLLAKEGGYSDLAASRDGKTAYCFYENGWREKNCILNKELCFARIPLKNIQ